VGVGVGVLGAPDAAEAMTTPPTPSAAMTAVPATTRDFLNILFPSLAVRTDPCDQPSISGHSRSCLHRQQ